MALIPNIVAFFRFMAEVFSEARAAQLESRRRYPGLNSVE
ncbi:hypothetical protein MCEMSEM23_01868 [Rhabdaerophilaceae bacterium]